jgi:hypothetical protein
MINLDYEITKPAVLRGWEHGHDVATAARADLWWSGFPGDVSIAVGAEHISTRFGWVPLLHFASSLVAITGKLAQPGSKTGYSFTEADDELRFDRGRELVQITATFSQTVLATSLPDLSLAARRFTGRLLDDLTVRYPGLPDNPAITELRERISPR